MAYSEALLSRKRAGDGLILESYSFNGSGVTTSGSQTPDTTDVEGIGVIKRIDSVNTDPGATGCFVTIAATRATYTLTFGSGDTGFYTVLGSAS